MHVGLCCDHFMGWQGGRDFFSNLLRCMVATKTVDREVTLIGETWRDLPLWRGVQYSVRMIRGRRNASAHNYDYRSTVEYLVQSVAQEGVEVSSWNKPLHTERRYEVIGPVMFPPRSRYKGPWLGYVPDCQHIILPHLFTKEERRLRDSVISNLLNSVPRVIVNSKETARELCQHFSAKPESIVPLPLALSPGLNATTEINPLWLSHRLKSGNYFSCCNQMWAHKNHRVVIEAIAECRNRGKYIEVVFTGSTADYRFPEIFRELVELAQTLEVSHQCHFLGSIPKAEQLAIIRNSIALIQPTLYEGGPGGGAGQESLALGVPVLLSNIPVNRELAEYERLKPLLRYFDPHSIEELANALIDEGENLRVNIPDTVLNEIGEIQTRETGTMLWDAFKDTVTATTSRH